MNGWSLVRRSTRRVVLAGSVLLALGGLGASVLHAESSGPASRPPTVRAVVHEVPIIHAHGPRQVPKVGRIVPDGSAFGIAQRRGERSGGVAS